jgi:hypothetical protein
MKDFIVGKPSDALSDAAQAPTASGNKRKANLA